MKFLIIYCSSCRLFSHYQLIRYNKELLKPLRGVFDSEEASSTVQGLTSDITSQAAPSGIAERIKNRRRIRYKERALTFH